MADESSKTTTPKKASEPTQFATALLEIDRGRVHDDASLRLQELVEAVSRTAGKGQVTIRLTVEPQDPETFDDTGMLLVSGDVSVVIPRPKRAPSIFYTGLNGKLTRDDPAREDPRD